MILTVHEQILQSLEQAKAAAKVAEDVVAWAQSIGIPPDPVTLAALAELRALSNLTPDQVATFRNTPNN